MPKYEVSTNLQDGYGPGAKFLGDFFISRCQIVPLFADSPVMANSPDSPRPPTPTGCVAFERGVVEDGSAAAQLARHLRSTAACSIRSPAAGCWVRHRAVSSSLEPVEAAGLLSRQHTGAGLRDATIGESASPPAATWATSPPLDFALLPGGGLRRPGAATSTRLRAWRLFLEAGAWRRTTGSATRCSTSTAARRLPPPALLHRAHSHNAWAWCYRGQAAEGIGENAEARHCYQRRRARPAGEEETDARTVSTPFERLSGVSRLVFTFGRYAALTETAIRPSCPIAPRARVPHPPWMRSK